MARYRVLIQVPNAEKPIQMFCTTRKLADEALKLLLDAGQPVGTKWQMFLTEDRQVARGIVEK